MFVQCFCWVSFWNTSKKATGSFLKTKTMRGKTRRHRSTLPSAPLIWEFCYLIENSVYKYLQTLKQAVPNFTFWYGIGKIAFDWLTIKKLVFWLVNGSIKNFRTHYNVSKLAILWIARDSILFVCSKMFSDSVDFRNYFLKIDQISLRKLLFFLILAKSDNILLHTKKLLSLAIFGMINLDTF